MKIYYLDDLIVGQTFLGKTHISLSEEQIKAFAHDFDPQPFHLNDEAANASIFNGLAASGWHTAAISMRLLVDSEFKPAGGIVGAGFEELRWLIPVRPGDRLSLKSEILDIRPSKTKPSQGIVKIKMVTSNQHGDDVLVSVGSLVVQRA
jgi:acyl dehydratase